MADALLSRLQSKASGVEMAAPPRQQEPPPQLVPPPLPEQQQRPRQMPDLRPQSVQRSEQFFGRTGYDQLLDYYRRSVAQSEVIEKMAKKANATRLILVMICFLLLGSSTAVNSAPICGREPTLACSNIVASIASCLAGAAAMFLALLEKSQARKSAIRLRDLCEAYAELAALLNRRLFTDPPSNDTPQGFIARVSQTFEALESRRKGPRPSASLLERAGNEADRRLQRDPALNTLV